MIRWTKSDPTVLSSLRTGRARALFVGAALSGLALAPGSAQAAPRPALTPVPGQVVAGLAKAGLARPRASSICAKVSPASVSAIVGYPVPAPTTEVTKQKATKRNFGISAVETSCTYGTKASAAARAKVVILSYATTSRAFTTSELRQELAYTAKALTESSIRETITPYSGLGFPAYYYAENGAGINGKAITAIDGTKIYGASVVDAKTVTKSQIVALTRLARKL
jgi:hypothetical protein